MALDGHQSTTRHTPTNQKQTLIMEKRKERRRDHWGAGGGGCISIALAVKEWAV